ncbi:hypothetical protein MTR_1g071460 [Medicago truncatula]|uniref:Uncharacterized protein n=1 Tax=Medicago truncatula TaxID=3880 RepID=G7IDK4_MEDTR|nr:hypothetical protein MTR_1g071460 [Medicago truncatula]
MLVLVLDVDNSYDKKEPHYSQLTLNAYKPLSYFAIIVSEITDSSLPNRTFLEILQYHTNSLPIETKMSILVMSSCIQIKETHLL